MKSGDALAITTWPLATPQNSGGMSVAGGSRHKPEKRQFSF